MIVPNVVIIGITGVGKTTVAKIVARQLGRKFIDLDKQIELRCGVDIATIFAIEGEAGFRARESYELSKIIHEEANFVLSVGGGAVLTVTNRQLIAQNLVIQLFANIDTVVFRLAKGLRNRPLLQNTELQQKVIDLYNLRRNFYNQISHLNINTSKTKPDAVAKIIIEFITKKHT